MPRPPRTYAQLAPAAVAVSLVALAGCRPPLPGPELKYREEREQAVKAALPAAAAAHFRGLRFFPFDPAYRFQAMIEPVTPPQPLVLAASDGSRRPAHRVGRVRLRFPNGEAVLSIFQLDDIATQVPDHLFLPFRDAGAGTTTYGAGRYVDVERLPGGVVSIDFNHAYNPDCAYGISGQCPITPEENTVKFAVEAGEMIPSGH